MQNRFRSQAENASSCGGRLVNSPTRSGSPLSVVRVFQPGAVGVDDLLRALELLLAPGEKAFEPVNPPRDERDPRLAFNPQPSESCVTDREPHNAYS
jgi:hypothetical protein